MMVAKGAATIPAARRFPNREPKRERRDSIFLFLQIDRPDAKQIAAVTAIPLVRNTPCLVHGVGTQPGI